MILLIRQEAVLQVRIHDLMGTGCAKTLVCAVNQKASYLKIPSLHFQQSTWLQQDYQKLLLDLSLLPTYSL